ncbi:hypothetical protein [Actinoplanes cyaneus]|uniref:hypothetical protein n=1 Tax=Actinoplanes cyaneus TaxID=52696 RepID=UPI001EF2E2C3|nr:hypothetical protein [Actinoplanes cyaneus]
MRRRTLLTGAAATALTGLANPTTTPHGLEKMLFAGAHPGTPLSSHDAAALLTRASQAYHAARYATLTHALPSLLSGLHAAHTQASDHVRETFAVMLVRAYVLASSVCTKLGDDAIAWVLADRALSTARQVDDSAALASATHTVAIAMRREGHHDGALTLLTSTAEGLNADRGAAPDALLGAYGNLLCTAAYSAAQAGNAGAATTYLDEATAAAARLQAPTRGVIPFSPTTVAIYKIGVYTAAGDTAAALQAAATVESHQLPTAERYGRYLLDTARAWTAHDRPAQAVQALLAAEQHAPGEVDRPSVRELVSRLLYAPTATPAGLRDLATRIGAAV